jgi:uncharacterized protein YnzC (UPF0291/DUF896 family)
MMNIVMKKERTEGLTEQEIYDQIIRVTNEWLSRIFA